MRRATMGAIGVDDKPMTDIRNTDKPYA